MSILFHYFHKYKLPFLTAAACVALESLCDLFGPALMANVIDKGIERGDIKSVYFWGSLMLIVTIAGACFAVARNILAGKVSQRMGADLRYDVFHKILCFSEEGADRLTSGSLITRMTNDTSQLIQFVNGLMRIFLKAPILCLGSIVLATILNIRLSIIVYGVILLITLLIYWSMHYSYPRFTALQKAIDAMNTKMQEYLAGVRVIKAFGRQAEEVEGFERENKRLMNCWISSQILVIFSSPLITLLAGCGSLAAIYFGAGLYTRGLTTPGEIAAFTVYMAQLLSSTLMITNIFNTFVRTKSSAERIQEILNEATEDTQKINQVIDSSQSDKGKEKGKTDYPIEQDACVEFRNVSFQYPGGSGVMALQNLSFEVKPHEKLAIIGPTGSGKSTICWLLLGFYRLSSGCILLNGCDISNIPLARIRKQIALIPQKASLFSGSVQDNIRWGKKGASVGEIRDAARKAEAAFIEKLPHGYETLLGGNGVNLSGGQRQRISLARGFVKKAPILLLDDATSALDPFTEERVQKNLKQEKGTCIIITQRFAAAMAADKILVLENGICKGFGTHKQLLSECEVYREIYKSQVIGGEMK